MFRHAHLLGSMRFCKKGSQLSLQLKEACKPWIFIWITYKVIGKSCAQKSLYYLIISIQHFVLHYYIWKEMKTVSLLQICKHSHSNQNKMKFCRLLKTKYHEIIYSRKWKLNALFRIRIIINFLLLFDIKSKIIKQLQFKNKCTLIKGFAWLNLSIKWLVHVMSHNNVCNFFMNYSSWKWILRNRTKLYNSKKVYNKSHWRPQ